jgi:hypothetical protein
MLKWLNEFPGFPVSENPENQNREAANPHEYRVSPVSDWDYWGVAPDSVSSKVGNVWPLSITPGPVGKKPTHTLLCTAALWSESEEGLQGAISEFSQSILNNFINRTDHLQVHFVPSIHLLASLSIEN